MAKGHLQYKKPTVREEYLRVSVRAKLPFTDLAL